MLRLFEREEARVEGWDDARVHLLEDFAKVFKGLMTVLTPDRPEIGPRTSLDRPEAAFAVADMAKSRALGHLMTGADESDPLSDDATEGEEWCAFADRSPVERRGVDLKRSKDFDLKAKAIIWPGLSYMCHIRSTPVIHRELHDLDFELRWSALSNPSLQADAPANAPISV